MRLLGVPLDMFRARIFWRLFTAFVLVVVVTTVAIGLLIDRRMATMELADIQSAVERQCLLLEPMARLALRTTSSAAVESEIQQLGKATGSRLTLLRENGEVIADSAAVPAQMDNHGDRPEVLAAHTLPYGVSRRRSATTGESFLYVARRVVVGADLLGFVRVALPLQAIDQRLRAMRQTILVGAMIACVLALLLGLIVTRRFTAPITAMTEVATAMQCGSYDHRVHVETTDEIGMLGEALNQLAGELTKKITILTQDREQLSAILAGMREGVLAIDANDRLLFSNQSARDLLGMASGESPRFWESIRHSGLIAVVTQARSKGHGIRTSLTIRDVGERIVDAHAAPLHGRDREGVVVVLHDVTELRMLEKIRQDFVANVSHELKTPLTSIKGYVETLVAGAVDDSTHNRRFLQKIDGAVVRLTSLVSDLLQLGRIEGLETALPLVPMSWAPLIADVHDRMGPLAADRGLTLRVVPSAEEITVVGHQQMMRQVIDNLVSNAMRYTPTGGVVEIALCRDNGWCRLDVKDTGMGIPAEAQGRIFERFFRVDEARSSDLGGTGLGLAIVKHAVHAMHGRIELTSELGKGSHFKVFLKIS